MELHLKIYLPGGELYVHDFPLECTFSLVRQIIEKEGLAKKDEYALLISSDSGTVISDKNDLKEVRKLLELKKVNGYFEAELSIKLNENEMETECQLQIILPTREKYF
jgi:hypothetical protein